MNKPNSEQSIPKRLAGAVTDFELISRFAKTRDEDAFRALVERHGPMVLAVCHRVLRNQHEAEDAFQATFLVLAQKAGKVRWRRSLANWLYAVAHRIALKSASVASKRRGRFEAVDVEMVAERPFVEVASRHAELTLEEQLSELPVKYRAPLVICYLQGRTREEAAQILGCSTDAVKGRLERGRQALRARLLMKGVTMPTVFLGVSISSKVGHAALSEALVATTVDGAIAFSGGHSALGWISSESVRLAKGELGMMSAITPGKYAAASALAALFIGVLALILVQERASAGKPRSIAVVVPSAFVQPGADGSASFISTDAALVDSGGKTDESRKSGESPRAEKKTEQMGPIAARSMQKLKELVIATHNYHDIARRFPAPAICDERGKPLLSWRVHLLPVLDEHRLYRQFHLDEPWDSEHNQKLIPSMPDALRSPASKAAPGKTTYLLVRGKDTVFSSDNAPTFSDVRDGSHNTIMIVETTDERAVTWTKPEDFVPDPHKPADGLVGAHKEGILAAFFDCKVRMLPSTISEETLNALFTSSGKEFVHSSRTRLITPKRRDAVAGLRRIGAEVMLADDGNVKSFSFPAGSTATDADLASLRSLQGLDRVEALGVHSRHLSDDGLKHVFSLHLPNITTLNLGTSSATDASLALVKNMSTLRNLYVHLTQVSDVGLAHVKELQNLEHLDVHSTKVTDAGLKHLSGLGRLRTLGVVKCRVTKAGIEELKEALPDCRIIH